MVQVNEVSKFRKSRKALMGQRHTGGKGRKKVDIKCEES